MKKILLSMIMIAVVFTSCDETKKVIDVAGSVQLSGTYTVTNLNNEKMKPNDLTLNFAALDRSVSGSSGCNTFFGKYTLDYPTLDFGDLATTKKACPDGNMTTESNYLEALSKVGSYGLQDNILTLYSKANRSVLITAKKDTNE